MRKLLLGLLLILGCATTSRPTNDRVVSTLYVANQSGGFVDVYIVETGWKLGSVVTNRGCLKIYESDLLGRDLVSLEFQISRDDSFVTPLINLAFYNWAISIGPYPQSRHIDALSIRTTSRC